MDHALERQLAILRRRAECGDIHEVEHLVAHLRAHYGDAVDFARYARTAYARRLDESLAALAKPESLEGFSIRLLADEVRACADRLGQSEPEALRVLERDGYRAAAERYAKDARRESSRQLQTRLRSFARHFAALAGPFCVLEINAVLAE